MRNNTVFVYDADKEINRIQPKAPTRFSTNGGKRNEKKRSELGARCRPFSFCEGLLFVEARKYRDADK